ncbi:MAG: NADH-quinone oxidoreductase subunit NuoK [Bacteroidia bacterium]|nr:NADH-quinone oxidoreductase subunit NuoK [Bacteroidia bacterium]
MSLYTVLVGCSLVLLAVGVTLVLSRTNAIAAYIGVELMLNGGLLSFVAQGLRHPGVLDGQVFVLVAVVVAAAEAAVALAIFLNFYKGRQSTDLDTATTLRDP